MADERRAPVQRDSGSVNRGHEPKPAGSVTWAEHEEAARDYHLRFRNEQDAEVLARRGGFGYWEMTDHLGHEPITWRANTRG